jgi:hypothetical protein
MGEIKEFLSSVLGDEDCEKVVDCLATMGAERFDDLRFINAETELESVLPVLKRRRLNSSLKEKFASVFTFNIFCCHLFCI